MQNYGERKCKQCGNTFIANVKNQKFCCKKCNNASKRVNAPVETRKCVICGNEFQTTNAKKITCSPECKKVRQRQSALECYRRAKEHPELVKHRGEYTFRCIQCGKLLTSEKQSYCSNKCREAYRREFYGVTKKNLPMPKEDVPLKEIKKNRKRIEKAVKEAKAKGISYGQWASELPCWSATRKERGIV